MKCLVSGATGFIGRQLCQQLTTQGDTVIALSKSGSPLSAGFPTLGLDLEHAGPDANLFQGVEVCFHLAGIAHQRAPDSAYQSLNCDATLRLARMAANAGVRCFIFLSSVKAMGPTATPVARVESDITRPIDPYGLSKWQAECALREVFAREAMSVVIVRPALVHGEHVKGNLQALARAVRWGLPRPPEGGRRSLIALEDLVELLCVFARQPPVGVSTWIACGNESYSTREIYDLLRIAGRQGGGVAWLPRWAWWGAARLVDLLAGDTDGNLRDKLFATELYSNAAVLAATQWRPRIRLEDTIERIVRSGRSNS